MGWDFVCVCRIENGSLNSIVALLDFDCEGRMSFGGKENCILKVSRPIFRVEHYKVKSHILVQEG